MKRIIKITVIVLAAIYFVLAPIVIAMIHGRVMSKCTYDEYDSGKLLVYDVVASGFDCANEQWECRRCLEIMNLDVWSCYPRFVGSRTGG